MGLLQRFLIFTATFLCMASCLPPEEKPEDPFGTQSLASGPGPFDAIDVVPITGFIDPNEFSAVFSTAVQSQLALNEEGGGDSLQTETGVQAFLYALRINDDGEYERYPLGTANVNNNGFFEFNVPNGETIFVSIGGASFGQRKRMLFTAPLVEDVTDGDKVNSILVEQSQALDYATTTVFKSLEKIEGFASEVTRGLNTTAIQMAGAVYEQALVDGNISEWTDADLLLYSQTLLTKIKEMNDAFAAGGVTSRSTYSKADLRTFNYDTVLTTINSQADFDMAYRSLVGNQIVEAAVSTSGAASLNADLNTDVLKTVDLDSMDNALSIARAGSESRLRAIIRRNFSGDRLQAMLVAIPLKVQGISTLTMAKSDLVDFESKDDSTNAFSALVTAAAAQNFDSALRSVFTGLGEQEKEQFNTQYTGNESVDPDEHDVDLLDILEAKCGLYGGQVAAVPSQGDDAEYDAFASSKAKFYCYISSDTACTSQVTVLNNATAFASLGYNAGGYVTDTVNGVAGIDLCEISNIRTSNEALSVEDRRSAKYSATDYYYNANLCRLMGGYVPALASDNVNFEQFCYFHIPNTPP